LVLLFRHRSKPQRDRRPTTAPLNLIVVTSPLKPDGGAVIGDEASTSTPNGGCSRMNLHLVFAVVLL
jgi:hypothetical protein